MEHRFYIGVKHQMIFEVSRQAIMSWLKYKFLNLWLKLLSWGQECIKR